MWMGLGTLALRVICAVFPGEEPLEMQALPVPGRF
jgi:hypothetical protein